MKIGILDLHREYAEIAGEVKQRFEGCFKNQAWILGESVVELEKQCAAYLGAKYAVGLNSGTDALILGLRALAIKTKGKEYFDKKDEIITTPFTFIATAEAIAHAGATPVFVDIDLNSFNIDPEAIEKAITRNTVGILPVHLYGLAARMLTITAIAKKHKLFVLEDVAQAFGAECGGKKLGTIGDCGACSFFPSKNLGGYGDAGMAVTNDKKIAELLTILRNHGQAATYKADYIGYNSRLDSIQAAVLLVKLKSIDGQNARRRAIAAQYDSAFGELGNIEITRLRSGCFHVYNLYTIRVKKNRDAFLKHLNDKGIGARVYYPHLLSQMKAFKNAKIKGKLTNAFLAVKQVVTLPVHPFLTPAEVDYVIQTVKAFW
jgi:dTDP-4-amino-4,6-dideoxygalactose transaminase